MGGVFWPLLKISLDDSSWLFPTFCCCCPYWDNYNKINLPFSLSSKTVDRMHFHYLLCTNIKWVMRGIKVSQFVHENYTKVKLIKITVKKRKKKNYMMVHTLDGITTEMYMQIRNNICNSIWLRHFVTSRAATNGIFTPKRPVFLHACAICKLPYNISTMGLKVFRIECKQAFIWPDI